MIACRVRRTFSLRSETKRNGSEKFFASKRKKVIFFALFACKRNTGIRSENESEKNPDKRKEKMRKRKEKLGSEKKNEEAKKAIRSEVKTFSTLV